jgi:hypothetical protein
MLVPRPLIHHKRHIAVPKNTTVINFIFQEIAAGPGHMVKAFHEKAGECLLAWRKIPAFRSLFGAAQNCHASDLVLSTVRTISMKLFSSLRRIMD